jgi:hypothetical protein
LIVSGAQAPALGHSLAACFFALRAHNSSSIGNWASHNCNFSHML